ncbi:carbohydrate ABC transporter permease [Caldinitratiruptor microaerophilus]|uniref:Sugar ABC transporter permease n=1 Tax=Caldinitratiruptor microaerophilus TaxID=671077 RepID=A0AA35CJA2_9FIRM|nr:carbohydrate ABC transporter permease [Caldinitratiruptor microaerophilus]BDG60127.1 sugar ABC transporter permease [Caldinitratiruptor microaerophilus]
MSHFWRRAPLEVLRQGILILASVSALFPLYFMLVNSLKNPVEYQTSPLRLPASLDFSNYAQALHAGFLRWFFNSIVITGASIVLVTFLAALAAYAVAWMGVPYGRTAVALVAGLMTVPPIIMVIPLFRMMADLQLVDTHVAVVLIYTGLMMPFSLFMLYNFFRSIPRELLEAVAIDGAGHLRAFWSVVLPLSRPAIVTLALVNMLWAWNELLIALVFLQTDKAKTLMVGITTFQSKHNLNVPVIMAGLFVATIPVVALYLAGQRYFIRGLTAGAIKE